MIPTPSDVTDLYHGKSIEHLRFEDRNSVCGGHLRFEAVSGPSKLQVTMSTCVLLSRHLARPM